MGTRHLIAVQVDGEYRVAQYGEWEGYPRGQGVDVLAFLSVPANVESLRAKARTTRWLSSEELAAIGQEHPRDWAERFPHLSREAGANILSLVANAEPGIALKNSIAFAGDSLFCEWADRDRLELFKGFNKQPVEQGARFSEAAGKDGYQPVRLVGTWPLRELPTVEDMETAAGDEES